MKIMEEKEKKKKKSTTAKKVYLIIVNRKILKKLILNLHELPYVSPKYGKVDHSLTCLMNITTTYLFIYLFIKL
jgi:hypothetical protein